MKKYNLNMVYIALTLTIFSAGSALSAVDEKSLDGKNVEKWSKDFRTQEASVTKNPEMDKLYKDVLKHLDLAMGNCQNTGRLSQDMATCNKELQLSRYNAGQYFAKKKRFSNEPVQKSEPAKKTVGGPPQKALPELSPNQELMDQVEDSLRQLKPTPADIVDSFEKAKKVCKDDAKAQLCKSQLSFVKLKILNENKNRRQKPSKN